MGMEKWLAPYSYCKKQKKKKKKGRKKTRLQRSALSKRGGVSEVRQKKVLAKSGAARGRNKRGKLWWGESSNTGGDSKGGGREHIIVSKWV